jgi:transcriptional regulator with XRE-family HTH domain
MARKKKATQQKVDRGGPPSGSSDKDAFPETAGAVPEKNPSDWVWTEEQTHRFREQFASTLAWLRHDAGVSVYALAQRSGVARQFLAELERGEKLPSWETACRIADALGVGIERFRCDPGNRPSAGRARQAHIAPRRKQAIPLHLSNEGHPVSAYIYLWTRKEYEIHQESAEATLCCAGSNQFRKRGVRNGERLYIVSCFGGDLYLIGRLDIGTLCSSEEANEISGDPGFDFSWAADWAFANPDEERPMRFGLIVPTSQVRQIRFEGDKPPVFQDGEDASLPDPQSFRGVRRITPQTADLFDRLLT